MEMLPIEYIEWYDHYAGSDDSIQALSTLSERINAQDYDLIFHSVGFVLWESETKVCIARNLRPEANDPDIQVSQYQVIYKALIIRRTKLVPEEAKDASEVTETAQDDGGRVAKEEGGEANQNGHDGAAVEGLREETRPQEEEVGSNITLCWSDGTSTWLWSDGTWKVQP